MKLRADNAIAVFARMGSAVGLDEIEGFFGDGPQGLAVRIEFEVENGAYM